jgi:hypothetical protein
LLSAIDAGDIEDVATPIGEIARATGADPGTLEHLVRELEFSDRLVRGGTTSAPTALQPLPAAPLQQPCEFEILTPISFRLLNGYFETLDHDGELIARLDPAELHALAQLVDHPDSSEAFAAHVAEPVHTQSHEARFMHVLGRFAQRGLLRPRTALPPARARPSSDRKWRRSEGPRQRVDHA